jgi:hypothetical protein
MARTVAKAIAQARFILLDERVPHRFAEETLRGFVEQGVEVALRLRPDLYVGTGMWEPPTDMALTDELPAAVDRQYFTPLCAYVAGLAESQDDQFTSDGRLAFLLTRFQTSLLATGV